IVIASSRPLGSLSFQPCASYSLVRSSTLSALMSSASSSPAWRWYESGGLPACSRLARMALALVPAPPATAALTTSIVGFLDLKSAIIALRISSSPAPVHHENTSTWSRAGSLGGAGSLAGSLAGSFMASLGGSLAGSLDLEHAAT